MKKMFFCAAAICCSALFAQEAAVAPAVAPAPVANTDSVQTVAPAETPVAAPAAEAANAAAPVADTAKVAAPAVETAKVDTVKAAEPVAAPVAEVAQVEDTAKVAEADTSKWSKFVGVSLTVPFESYKAGGKKINFINYRNHC